MITSERNTLVLHPKHGAVQDLVRDGVSLLRPARDLFSVTARGAGEPTELFSSAFASFGFDGKKLRYARHPALPGLEVVVHFRVENGCFYFRPEIAGGGATVESVDLPYLLPRVGGQAVVPYSEGYLCADEFIAREGDDLSGIIRKHRYPALVQMQFIAHAADNGMGVYLGAQDPDDTPKYICVNHDRRIMIRSLPGDFEWMLTTFDGGWMGAGECYRQWVETQGRLRRPASSPAWLDDSPVVVTYPMRWHAGLTRGGFNEFYPYDQALAPLLAIAKKTDSRVLAALMQWDQHGAWLPPYAWPPAGGTESLFALCDGLHQHGHRLGLYGSGAAWTQRSLTNDYSTEDIFARENLARHMVHAKDGKLLPYDMDGLRTGFHMCVGDAWTRGVLREQARAVAEAGVDFFQLFD